MATAYTRLEADMNALVKASSGRVSLLRGIARDERDRERDLERDFEWERDIGRLSRAPTPEVADADRATVDEAKVVDYLLSEQ